MSQQLDRSVRAYVARGTGLDGESRPAGQRPRGSGRRCPTRPLLPVSDLRTGAPQYRQMVERRHRQRRRHAHRDGAYRRTYSLQFYRDNALDLANAFERWAASEDGLIAADTAFASYGGRLRRIRRARRRRLLRPAAHRHHRESRHGSSARRPPSPQELADVHCTGIGLPAFRRDYVRNLRPHPTGRRLRHGRHDRRAGIW